MNKTNTQNYSRVRPARRLPIKQITACSLFFAMLTGLAAQSSQDGSTAPGQGVARPSPGGIIIAESYPGKPWLDYSKLPWVKPPSAAASCEVLLGNLKDDLDSTLSSLSALTDSLRNANPDTISDAIPAAVAEFNDLPSKNLSTLCSQDLSCLMSQDLSVSCGQLLSTSFAVPSCPPWVPRYATRAIGVGTSGGTIVLPAYPPRTAWGNGPGVVATTPGGAVFSMVPAGSQTMTATGLADSAALRDINRRLLLVQSDVERLEAALKKLKTSPNLQPTPLTYFSPAGR